MTDFPQTRVASWSNTLPALTSFVKGRAGWDQVIAQPGTAVIARGAGHSFGDAAYLDGGFTCSSLSHDQISTIDTARHTITVGGGVTLGAFHRHLDSTPYEFSIFGGTASATAGGAAAGDIHGKNHVLAGSFGAHVVSLGVVTIDGRRIDCSSTVEPDLFSATLGGMGLTGFIESVTLKLSSRGSSALRQRRALVTHPGEMDELFMTTSAEFSYCVWPDLARKRARGFFCAADRVATRCPPDRRGMTIPLPRIGLLQPWTIGFVGEAILRFSRRTESIVHIRDFNYSGLPEIFLNWNMLYGRRGMIEYQFVLPSADFLAVLRELVSLAQHHSLGLLAAVVKKFGIHEPAGLLSFPSPGFTINFQMPNTLETVSFLRAFTDVLLDRGGRVNLTKDSCLTAGQFSRMFPHLEEWRKIVRRFDPAHRIRSGLSNRLAMKPW